MRAVRQGDLDALCGVYAIINALEGVGIGGPRSLMHQRLFRRLTLGLPADRLQAAMYEGLDAEDLVGTGRRAFRWLRQSYGHSLRITRPLRVCDDDDIEHFFDAVAGWTQRADLSVIVNVHLPGLSHWTVVKRVRGRIMELRDSGRLKTLDLDRFSLSRGRYRFSRQETLLIKRHNRRAH